MKKTTSILLIFSFLMSVCLMQTAYADSSDYVCDNKAVERSEGLLDALNIDYTYSKLENEVTREAYTRILTGLLNANGSSLATVHGFSDVDEGKMNYKLGYAVNTGIISKSENFYPERIITYAEAIKMAVVALGYANEAQISGGYPYGYMIQASKLKLTSGMDIDSNAPMTYAGMFIILDNLVNIDIRKQTGFGDTYEYQTSKGHTVLTEYFKLEKVMGVIEGDEYTSLYDKNLKAFPGHITIAGEGYLYGGSYVLGERVIAYVTTDEAKDRIVYMHSYETNTRTIYPTDYPCVENGRFCYNDEEVRMSSHVAVLYNGEAYISYQNSDLEIKSGNIQLIDNDNNKSIDVIHINECAIFITADVNVKEGLIFVDGGTKLIDLTSNERYCRILVDGQPSDISAIGKDMVISCYYNKNDEPVCLSVSTKQISGNVNEIALNEQHIYIDGNKYFYNEHFKTKYISDVKPGVNMVFLLDSDGYITSVSSASTDFVFGYMINLKKGTGLSDTTQMKVFTQGGEIKIYDIAKKVRIDSKKYLNASDAVLLSCFYKDGNVKEQLIRYMLNENGEISHIDTEFGYHDHNSGVPTTGFYNENADAFDSLIRYAFNGSDTATTIPYKTTGVMVPYFYMSVYTPVIVVNKDTSLSDEDRFMLTTRNIFMKDRGYVSKNLLPYNVKEDGGVEILVYYDESGVGNSALDTESEYGVVESFNQAIIPATGESGYRLSVFNGSTFRDLYIKDISAIERLYTGADKQKGELPLSPGDFVRFAADARNMIKGIEKDYDESNKLVINYANTGNNSTLRYDIGKVYAKSSASMLMISSTTNTDDIENGTAILKCINTSNIGIIYDSKTEKVSPASYNDIIPYVYSPELCSTVFIRNRYALGYMFVIYR